jgi:hypothetical protein
MRFMAIQTVFCHRRMFPEEGAALVSVTLVAIFVRRCFRQEFFIRRAVRVVTVTALYFPFPEGHVG